MLTFVRRPEKQVHVSSRVRAYGKARLDIASRARSSIDWDRLWKKPLNPFPFAWDELWKQCIEYRVDDFAAEVGFFIDVLGFSVNAFDPDYAMFTSPLGEFYFSVVPVRQGEKSTPPESFRLQFLIRDILQTAEELLRRGIAFENWPRPCTPGSNLFIGTFRSPHGIAIDLWGFVPEDPELSQGSPSNQKRAERMAYSGTGMRQREESRHLLNNSTQSDEKLALDNLIQDSARSGIKREDALREIEYIYEEGT